MFTNDVDPDMKPKKSEPAGMASLLGLAVENVLGVYVEVPSVQSQLMPRTVVVESAKYSILASCLSELNSKLSQLVTVSLPDSQDGTLPCCLRATWSAKILFSPSQMPAVTCTPFNRDF